MVNGLCKLTVFTSKNKTSLLFTQKYSTIWQGNKENLGFSFDSCLTQKKFGYFKATWETYELGSIGLVRNWLNLAEHLYKQAHRHIISDEEKYCRLFIHPNLTLNRHTNTEHEWKKNVFVFNLCFETLPAPSVFYFLQKHQYWSQMWLVILIVNASQQAFLSTNNVYELLLLWTMVWTALCYFA